MNKPTYKFNDPEGEQKLAELMLHIALKCEKDPTFGAIKLNKILWWSDSLSYARTGKPITGVEYQRLRNGPAPKRLVPVRKDMIAMRHAALQKLTVGGGRTQKRLIALRLPDYGLFMSEQIAFVDETIASFWGKTAQTVSDLSHGKAWEIALDKQSIPYESVFLSDEPVTRLDVIRTQELADRYGWERA